MRYDRLWRNLVRRAVRQADVDLDAFIDMAADGGMNLEAIQRRLMDDLENNGPIFGKFFRSVSAAAAKTTNAAYSQGVNLSSRFSEVKSGKGELARLLAIEEMDLAVTEGDPEEIERLQKRIADRDERMWVAQMQKTCHRCLPLHGTIKTLAEWEELGVDPDTIHDGWESECYCSLVPVTPENRGDRTDHMLPLVRNKLESVTGKKGSKRTARGVLQVDMEKALAARNKAMESVEGRRTLRMLGQTQAQAQGETDE